MQEEELRVEEEDIPLRLHHLFEAGTDYKELHPTSVVQ